ncbi:uncharacterized protein LOC116084801 [Mastomys coucha]|uniref:uncharacterized protein LOC116084801 n=1 Tax=Mastomys coucha TaxID=35658 RepID=UPI0012619E40|nr:uncharacterized protein LOC116084801 [Mastomys coucha]
MCFVKVFSVSETGTQQEAGCGPSRHVVPHMASRGRCCTHISSFLQLAEYLAKASDKNQIFKTFQAPVCSFYQFLTERDTSPADPPDTCFQALAFLSHFPSCPVPESSEAPTMLLMLLQVLGINFLLREAQAQSVTQPDAHVTVPEEASLQLRCKYSYSGTPYLFWYVQYPWQGLELLLKYYSGNPVVQGVNGFEAEFNKSDSSFHLRKASVHWRDSAVYFCALSAQCVGL